MSLPTWREMRLADIEPCEGWKYDDAVLLEKLATSLRRHGQLRALVVRRTADGRTQLVDGAQLLRAMLALGWEAGWVADLAVVDEQAAERLRLDLELRFEVDYARLAYRVAALVDGGAAPDSLSQASPYSSERITYFVKLANWDWSQYRSADDGQAALAWETDETAPAEALALPQEAITAKVAMQAPVVAKLPELPDLPEEDDLMLLPPPPEAVIAASALAPSGSRSRKAAEPAPQLGLF